MRARHTPHSHTRATGDARGAVSGLGSLSRRAGATARAGGDSRYRYAIMSVYICIDTHERQTRERGGRGAILDGKKSIYITRV